jgi:hypothetical protein
VSARGAAMVAAMTEATDAAIASGDPKALRDVMAGLVEVMGRCLGLTRLMTKLNPLA